MRGKSQEETFQGERYVHYLDYGDGFMSIYIYICQKLYTLNMYSLVCQLYLSEANF